MLDNIVGVRVHNAQFRERYRTYFYRPHEGVPSLNSLMLVTEGKALLEFGETRLTAGPGSLLCLASGELLLARSDPKAPVSYFMLNFDLVGARGGRIPAARAGIPFYQRVTAMRPVRKLLAEIAGEWRHKRRHFLMNCSKRALDLFQTMEETAHPVRKPLSEGYSRLDARIAGILDFLRVNYKKNFSVEFLAKKASLHPKYFSRLFKKMAGISPHQFQLRRKIDMAKDWLLLYEEPFLYTGEDLGFSDYSHFFRVFRKLTGLTPRDYCRKFRAERLPPGRPRRGRPRGTALGFRAKHVGPAVYRKGKPHGLDRRRRAVTDRRFDVFLV